MRFEFFQPRGREQRGDDGEPARQQTLDDFVIRGHQHAGPLVFLDAAQRPIQRQLRRVEGLNGLDVQNRQPELNRAEAGMKSAEVGTAPNIHLHFSKSSEMFREIRLKGKL